MKETITNKVNEIALMLVMTDKGDTAGIGIVLELCRDLAKLASPYPEYERLCAATSFLQAQADSPTIVESLKEFATNAASFIQGVTNVVFAHEGNSASLSNASPSTTEVDVRFLTEYIETHSLLLDDFEASLLDFKQDPKDPAELSTSVKRYLHNLKGDSGAIGLYEIEKVCHVLEERLLETEAADFTNELLAFKEWMCRCLHSYTEGKACTESAHEILEKHILKFDRSPKGSPSGQVVTPPKRYSQVSASDLSTQSNYTLGGEKDIFTEFASEAEEHLNNVESVILDAEGNYSKDAIDTIFRGVHSIKGGSAYFNLEEMIKCSHILENFLSEVREGSRILDQTLGGLLLTYIDLQKNVLTRARTAVGGDGVITWAQGSVDFLSALETYGRGGQEAAQAVSPDPSRSSEDARDQKNDKLNLKTFVKVDTARLDLLIDSIGEMVIYSSMLIRHCRELLGNNEGVMDATHRVEKFSRDLQDIGMSMRLVPIKGLFQKMSRLVWDTSKKLKKEVEFSMEGEDTELDRNLIDKLADPLMHMVRNSLDHGVEAPDERQRKGKSRSGKVKLSAYHAGGSIHIKIEDDGKGLNAEKLLAKAIEKGLVPTGQSLSEKEIHQLIFAPGFSTAAVVTDISGRGVGMDVVRRNVESLRGRIHIESSIDKGSTFTIELPLTLAIIDGVELEVGSETFIVPSLSVLEFVRPKREMLNSAFDRQESLEFRGKYLPIYRIADLYNIEPRYRNPLDATMVIVESNQQQIALMVDCILGECSTVIKNLGRMFESSKGLAGCAIMPHGNVSLILDVGSLVQLAHSEYKHNARSLSKSTSQEVTRTEVRA